MARTLTWTTLRLLDPGRRRILFTFLQEFDLISIIDLSKADLSGTELRGANLRDANLSEAHVTFANLQGTKLVQANLAGLDLRAARVTMEQLESQAKSLKGTIMPDGSVHP